MATQSAPCRYSKRCHGPEESRKQSGAYLRAHLVTSVQERPATNRDRTRIVREIDLTRRLSSQGPSRPMWCGCGSVPRRRALRRLPESAHCRTRRDRSPARAERGYSFVGPVDVEVFVDDDVKTGDVAVETDYVVAPVSPGSSRTTDGPSRWARHPDHRAKSPGRCGDQRLERVAPARRSLAHCRRVAIRDLRSTNGTFVNGHRIDAVSLSPRDDIAVGTLHFRIEMA